MKSLKGHLLVASPSLMSPFFARTVILMFDHSQKGAMGVVLNRPTEANVCDVAEQVLNQPLDWSKPIHLGGPVTGPLLVVHVDAELADQEVLDGVYQSIDADKVRQILQRQCEPSLIVANYAGWGPGQLEGELAEDSWLTCDATMDLVFWEGARDLWTEVVSRIRSTQLQNILGLDNLPADPSVN
jgi:putative transcriptional regulator